VTAQSRLGIASAAADLYTHPSAANRGLSEFVEQGAGGLQIGGVDAFLEPTEDRGEEGDRLLLPAAASRIRYPIGQMHRETYAVTP
jgi:hypothetical protein